jgi:V8-like Glu-specific endopeptidase
MITGVDRRRRILEDESDMYGYPGIGLLRVEFDGVVYTGTASLIANGKYLLTCAHNVVDYCPPKSSFQWATSAWFELRNNRSGETFDMMKARYKVTRVTVHPRYFEDPNSYSGFDLAHCSIEVPEDDRFIQEIYCTYHMYMPSPLAGAYSTTKAAVIGFPVEHMGEKWGMAQEIPPNERIKWKFNKSEEKNILTYSFIDTSPGQSGSPILGMGPKDVVGVHTGGSAIQKQNWGTYLDWNKLKWIADDLKTPIQEDSNQFRLGITV